MGLDWGNPDDLSNAEKTMLWSEQILGSRGWLKGVQLGNEPDLYLTSSHVRSQF